MAPEAAEGRGGRHSRQQAVGVIGAAGQEALARASVAVVGCGALGGLQAEALVRAGIGRMTLVDRDVVEVHNLQRQVLFSEDDVGWPKAEAAARRLRAIDARVRIEPHVADLTPLNLGVLLGSADLVLDGTDNFETRFLLNDAAVEGGKPWVYGGVLGTAGTMMAIRPGQGPCLRCVLPEPPAGSVVGTCETHGVLLPAAAWVAALQVTAAFQLLVGDPEATFPLRSLDVWRGTVRSVAVPRDPDCPCCGRREFPFARGERGATSTVLCGRDAVQVTPERPGTLDLTDLARRLAPLGGVSWRGLVLELSLGPQRLVVFPDGRVLVEGTSQPSEARSLVARYLGW